MITYEVFDRTPTLFAKLYRYLAPKELNIVAARAGQQAVREHLFGLDRSRANALGGPRTHFYGQAARATSSRYDEVVAAVIVSHLGIAQRYFGGDIKPTHGKYLTIPAISEAHGRRASEFDNLKVFFGRGGIPRGLKEAGTQATIKGKSVRGFHQKGRGKQSVGGRVVYWFSEGVHQDEDKSVLPTNDELRTKVREDFRDYYAIWKLR